MRAKRVVPGKPVDLKAIATEADGGMSKSEAIDAFGRVAACIGELTELMSAAATKSLLVVVQGMDTAGKDGSIRDVFSFLNPSHCRVASFKVPSATELGHDFLWRVHAQTPERGQTVIFNRSHYEDVLIVRVHNLMPKRIWSARYEQINAFEEQLVRNDTIVLKFFLHISKGEQELRLLEREADPLKSWKLSVADWEEREHWRDYQEAYADALAECSTKLAPWYIIPADHKWFRNLAMAEVIAKALEPYEKEWVKRLDTQSTLRLHELAEARTNGLIPHPDHPILEQVSLKTKSKRG